MAVVKAEYLVAKDSESGEEQNVKFVPPAPSDGDLGGISKEDSEQIRKNKNDIADIRMTLWDKILDKLTSAVVERLNTTDKTVIGALNELNSNQAPKITSVKTSILKTEITLLKTGNVVVISYTGDTTDNVKRGDLQVVGVIPPDYVPRQRFVIAPIQSTAQRIQLTVEKNGNILAYNYGNELTTQTVCRYNGCYVC